MGTARGRVAGAVADPGLGWRLLRAGEWEAARAAFVASLRAEETAEAFEGLSWAVWWMDDAAAVFDARERAFALYRSQGDRASAGRIAAWLAADELDFNGALAVARGWLRRGRRLLEGTEVGADHGWLAFHEGYVAQLGNDTARARLLAGEAARIGHDRGVPDLEMLGLALEGASLIACARIDDGMARLDEATASADDATNPISGAWTCCFMVSACAAILDHQRAREWCDRIARFAERYGSRYMLAFCRAEYGAVERWRGRWAEAERLLATSIEDFASSRPAWAAGPLVGLAELRRRQGRTDEALELLDRVGADATGQLVRGWIMLDQGHAVRAAETAELILRRLPAERVLDRSPALELLVRARIARGQLERAEPAFVELTEIADRIPTPAFRARFDAVAGLLAAARGHHDDARCRLEDAIDGFERAGAPVEASEAMIELAISLQTQGRVADARQLARGARRRLVALGATPAAERAARLLGAPAAVRVTRREGDVLSLLVDGLTNRQIAERLVVSEHTVHRHMANILGKLDLPSRTAAAAYAVQAGLVEGRGR